MIQPASSPPDRLPWLSEIPRIGLKPEPERSRFPWAAVAIGLAFAFIAVAAYLLGFRNAGVGTEAKTRAMPLDQPFEQTPPPARAATEDNPAERSEPARQTPVTERVPAPDPAPTSRSNPRPKPQTSTRPPSKAQRLPAGASVVEPAVIVRPVVRGRIIQLGAFPSHNQAETAWRALVAKWPYLATKPRLVTTIDVRSTDGKATRMHRLQLATASQAQSVVICQQLEKTRQNCVVVY